MPRRKKTDDVVASKEAPVIETNLIDGIKPQEAPIEDLIPIPTDDLVIGSTVQKEIIDEVKNKLFEPTSRNTKTLIINKIVPKKQTPQQLSKIKSKMTLKPLMSRYRGSRTRKNNSLTLSFKVGNNI